MENGKVKNVLKALLRKCPSGLQFMARDLRTVWDRYNPTAKSRWIRNSYTPFGRAQRQQVFLEIARFAHINRPISGYYMEFGSHEANTMRQAWNTFHFLFDWKFIAFDSFEGLPEIQEIDRQEIWKQGKLKTAEERFVSTCLNHGVDRQRLRTVKGFYNKSLTEELKKELLPSKAAVVYVDCDLYHSTVPVLEFIKDFIQKGTVIVFDDWNCFLADPEKGERRAWREFCARYPDLRFEDFVSTGMQKAFVSVGLRSEVSGTAAD